MPNYDGTGPQGQGPKTGRGLGNCSGKNSSQNRPYGTRGRGMGRANRPTGRGQGRGQ